MSENVNSQTKCGIEFEMPSVGKIMFMSKKTKIAAAYLETSEALCYNIFNIVVITMHEKLNSFGGKGDYVWKIRLPALQ